MRLAIGSREAIFNTFAISLRTLPVMVCSSANASCGKLKVPFTCKLATGGLDASCSERVSSALRSIFPLVLRGNDLSSDRLDGTIYTGKRSCKYARTRAGESELADLGMTY